MKRFHYFKLAVIGTMVVISLNGFSQKCTKFINYQTKTLDTKGINMQIFGQSVGVGATNISTLQRDVSEKLQQFDLLQYNICEQLKSIKNDFVREKLQTQYSNLLMKMLDMIKVVENNQSTVQQNTNTTDDTKPNLASKNTETTDETPNSTNVEPASSPTHLDKDGLPVSVSITAKPVVYENENVDVEITFPCGDFSTSTKGTIRGFGMESSMDAQIAKRAARTAALEELASKIEITVKSVTEDYFLRTQKNLTEEIEKRLEGKTQTSVNKTLTRYTTACEKFTQNKSTKKYSCYIALEINEENVLKPIYQELQQDAELKPVLPNYEKFAKTFNDVMNSFEKSF